MPKQADKQAVVSPGSRSHARPFVSSSEISLDGRRSRLAAERSGASARTDVHFMGRHVVSVQWRKVWFFPGNFGLFNRDPISRSARLAGFELRQRGHRLLPPSLSAQFSTTVALSYSVLRSFDLLSFSHCVCVCVCLIHSIITSRSPCSICSAWLYLVWSRLRHYLSYLAFSDEAPLSLCHFAK